MAKVTRETARGFAVGESAAMNLTNSTAETSIFSQVIKGGVMGANKELSFSILCNLTTGLVPPNITIKVKLGSGSLTIASALAIAISITSKPFIIEGKIVNKDSGSQLVYAKVTQYSNAIPIISSNGVALDSADWTIDTTQDQTFSVTAQFSALSSSSTLTFRNATIELT